MLRITYPRATFFSGFLWLLVGLKLFSKGIMLLVNLVTSQSDTLVYHLNALSGIKPEVRVQLILMVALWVGFMKGNFMLKKSADRVLKHIVMQEEPIALKKLYPKSYFIILAVMMGLGMSLKWVPMQQDLKGFIDLAIGSALMIGSWHYFKKAWMLKVALKNL